MFNCIECGVDNWDHKISCSYLYNRNGMNDKLWHLEQVTPDLLQVRCANCKLVVSPVNLAAHSCPAGQTIGCTACNYPSPNHAKDCSKFVCKHCSLGPGVHKTWCPELKSNALNCTQCGAKPNENHHKDCKEQTYDNHWLEPKAAIKQSYRCTGCSNTNLNQGDLEINPATGNIWGCNKCGSKSLERI
jgi:DNA-directed RNA polymerase subunit RPC12/RpoP